MILGTINGDGDIWCRRVFRPVPMPGSKGRTELLPVGSHECSELVFGQVFQRIEKVERIPAHRQRQFQFFDGAQITHHAYRIRLLKENAPEARHWQATPATKLLIREFVCFVEQDAQPMALPEIARIPTIAKEAGVETCAFSRQIIEFWMICVETLIKSTIGFTSKLVHLLDILLYCALVVR
jgi:hypothetical protein